MYSEERIEVRRVILSRLNDFVTHSDQEELDSFVMVRRMGYEGFYGGL